MKKFKNVIIYFNYKIKNVTIVTCTEKEKAD